MFCANEAACAEKPTKNLSSRGCIACVTRIVWRCAAPKPPLPCGRSFLPFARMIRAVDHINIVVTDLERSVRFYTEVLGFKKTKEAYLEGEWIERIVGLRGVKARAVFIVAPA